MDGSQMVLLGLLLLVTAFVLRRSFSGIKKSQQRDPLKEARQEIRAAETGHAAKINRMELKLHDYDREIDGRTQTQIALLDQLVIEHQCRSH